MILTKYSASGNDFLISHSFIEKDFSKEAINLCNRTEGPGADGLVILIPQKDENIDFKWLFYNSDGSVASMCGNASRACAHYAYNNNLARAKMNFLTGAGIISSFVKGNIVQSMMTKDKVIKEEFTKEGYTWYFIDTGVPHLVCICKDLDEFDLKLCKKMREEYNANVNFVKIEDNKLYVRTFERGVEGETKACGTGMVACFLRAFRKNLITNEVKVYPKSKEELSIKEENKKVYFKGRVKKIYTLEV